MGQSQFLLLVLALILVAITFFVGVNLFVASAAQSNRDAVISDLIHLSSIAHAYYRIPEELGGGGNSFVNFKIPEAFLLNGNGAFEHTKKGHPTDHIHFEATGKEIGQDGIDFIKVEIRITSDEIKLTNKN